jgi:homoserine O-acetyltransferase
MSHNSVGLVKEQVFTFGSIDNPMQLKSGHVLGPVDIVYETYGAPNEDRSNAVLVLHALSGDAHAAGYYHPNDKRTGWWDSMVGPGKTLDTTRYWVICSNIIGGCKGSTGPGSINPKTGKQYNLDFPIITVGDMVDAQKRLIEHLGIERLYAILGGSFGGFQVIEWTLRYPEMVRSALCVASSSKLSAQALAFNAVGRQAITSDPGWMGGNYEGTPGPVHGLAIARMIGHITYLSDLSMDSKFGRRLQSADRFSYDFTTEFAVESYLKYQGEQFIERFDANSYLYITKAMDYFDVSQSYGPLNKAFSRVMAKYLLVSYNLDWLFTTEQSKEIVRALLYNDKDVTFIEVDSPYGHDAFLIEQEQLDRIIRPFLESVMKL